MNPMPSPLSDAGPGDAGRLDTNRGAAEPCALADEFLLRIGQRRLCVARCRASAAVLPYAAHRRPDEVSWEDASGRARLASFTVMWQAYRAERAVPYNVAWVELDEGPRLISTVVVADPRVLRIGMALRARFDGDGKLVFDPDDEPPPRDGATR